MTEDRKEIEALLKASSELRWAAAWPPGVRESDSWYFDEKDSTAIFTPDGNRWPSSLKEAADLADLLEPASDAERPTPYEEAANRGIDQLAWYQTFRNPIGWGIHLRESGLEAVARYLGDSNPDQSHRKSAFHALYLHEYAHFLFDVAAVVLEDIVGGPIYEPHRLDVVSRPYGYDESEEALCNAFAYRNSAATTREGLGRFLRDAPPGYRDFDRFRTARSFSQGVEQAIGEMLRGLGGRSAAGTSGLFDIRGAIVSPWLVPVYLDRDRQNRPLFALITALSDLRQSSKFARELKKLPNEVRREWTENVEPMLQTDISRCQFKALTGRANEYTVRVGHTYRAILVRSGRAWTATEIVHRKDAYR